MNSKQEFALALIRAPWAKRLTDRTFILAVVAVVIGLWLFTQKAITGSDLCTLISYTWGPWILGNQATTAFVGTAAVKSDMPETVNAGSASFNAPPADTTTTAPEIAGLVASVPQDEEADTDDDNAG